MTNHANELESSAGNSDDAGEIATASASPRGFAIGAGLWFLVIGVGYASAGCVLCLASGVIFAPRVVPTQRWADFLRGDDWPLAVLVINVLAAHAGGWALVGAGIGLRAERPSGATVGLVTSGLLALLQWSSCAVFLLHAHLVGAGAYAVAGLVSTLLFLVAAGCRETFRRFPPPPGMNVATKEFLEAHATRRRRY